VRRLIVWSWWRFWAAGIWCVTTLIAIGLPADAVRLMRWLERRHDAYMAWCARGMGQSPMEANPSTISGPAGRG